MDPALRPLFVQIATLDRFSPVDGHSGRDAALRRVLTRKITWLDVRVASSETAALAHNLRFLATSVGGLTVVTYEAIHPLPDQLTGLLPGTFQHLGLSVTSADLVDGIRPDIVGELYLLDRLNQDPTTALASKRLLKYAAKARPEAYKSFVERAVADHAEHPNFSTCLKRSRIRPLPWQVSNSLWR